MTMTLRLLNGFVLTVSILAVQSLAQHSRSGEVYFCTPCGDGRCDTIAYDHPGLCPICTMPLIAKIVSPKNGLHQDAQSFDKFIGYWQGMGESAGQKLNFSLEIIHDSTDRVVFSSDDVRAQNIPGNNIYIANDSIHFDLTGDIETLSFTAGRVPGGMRGIIKKTFRSGGEKHPQFASFELTKARKQAITYTMHEVGWKNGDVTLSGSLYLPNGKSRVPAIVFTHGSGAEQRYANASMADYFANRGIAVLIYDKRGTGRSTGNWQTSTYEDLAGDCMGGIQFLKTQPMLDPAKIGIFGHSQGGTISPLIVTRSRDIAFDIASAAFGVSPEEQDVYRVSNILRNDAGFSEAVIDSAIAFYKIWLTVARTGTGWDHLEKVIPNVETTSWYAWVAPPPKDHWIWKWYLSAGNFHPIPYWEKVTIPVLLLYGEKDFVTPPSPSIHNIQAALRKAGNKHVKIVVFPDMTHEGNMLGTPDEFWHKAAPGYCDTVYHWMQSVVIGH